MGDGDGSQFRRRAAWAYRGDCVLQSAESRLAERTDASGATHRAAGESSAARLSNRIRQVPFARMSVVLISLGLLWRAVRYALGFPIWGDEAFVAVDFVLRDFRGMIEPLTYGQIVPLVFMWVELAVSRVLGYSEWALRLFPFLVGVAALFVFARFARTLFNRRAALLAVGIFAASYSIVRHSVEVKPYGIDLFIALLMTMSAWAVLTQPSSLWRWIALILLAQVTPWWSYPSVLVGGAIGVVLTWRLIHERFARRMLIGWAIYGLVLCGSFVTMYLLYGRPHARAAAALLELESWRATFPPLREFWKLPVWFVLIHTGHLLSYPVGGSNGGSTATLVLVIVGAVRLWRQGRRELVLLLLLPLAFTFMAAALQAYPYGGSARTSQYMAPAFCLLAGYGLHTLLAKLVRSDLRPIAIRVAGVVLGAIAVGGIVGDLIQPYKSTPVKASHDAVRTLAARAGPADRWVTFNAAEPVDYAPWLGDWGGVGGQWVFDMLRFAPVPLDWAPRPEAIEVRPGGKLWLFCYHGYQDRAPFPRDLWEKYLAEVTARFGSPKHEQFVIKRKGEGVEALEVYEFPLRSSDGGRD